MISYTKHRKQPPRAGGTLKANAFDQLLRRYRQVVKEKYWLLNETPQKPVQPFQSISPQKYVDDMIPVWVVDDNPDVHILMRLVFNRITPNVTPTFFMDGDELLNQLETASVLPRVILLDLYMKRIDGFDTLRHVRTHAASQHLPVVMLTASLNEHDRQKALSMGADEFVTKPLAFDDTIKVVNRLIDHWL
ncbi:response regulator [Spirosoma soli]|uniref:Response regulator n=1 Tax=Spirosoma soli TaxID=1770529 RepID=A0ABW5M4G9_9BACT